MRILLVTAYFPPDVGSASHLFHELGRSFLERGHTVGVVTGFPGYHPQGDLSRYRAGAWMQETMDGLEVTRIRVPEVARNTPLGRGLWQFSCMAAFTIAGMRIDPPDVILVYSPPLPLGLSGLLLRTLRRAPVVVNIQDLFPQSAIDLGILRSRTLIRVFERIERFIYGHADAVSVHSEGNRRHVLGMGGRPGATLVVHNSVDTDHIRPAPRMNELRREFGLDERFVASFGGIMGFSQDLDVILQAADVLRDRKDIAFLLAGEGVEKERCMQKSRDMKLDSVTWLPMLPRERYPLLLHASDACLTTLKADVKTPVVPSKILSAMAAARAVVAALDEKGDAPRLIAEAEAGYSLPPEDASALARTLVTLAEDRGLCTRLGENGRRYAERHLSPRAVAIDYERLFGKLREARRETGSRVPGDAENGGHS